MLVLFATLYGAVSAGAETAPMIIPDSQIEPVTWRELAGWDGDDHAAAYTTFLASCRAISRTRPAAADSPLRTTLRKVCRDALAHPEKTAAQARKFFETRLRPMRIARLGERDGFLTGYYEPIVEGSREKTDDFTVPMYRRPPDLISEAPPQDGAPANKGRAFRQVGDERLPYYERGEIEQGALDGKGLEICWLKDPTDAFFIHIQGSARVRLPDGTVLRLNYDGHNGHPYTPIGRPLMERNIIPRDEMSMQRIRKWMQANPEEGKELRRVNKSFVFFRVAALADHEEAIGAQGIPLTAGRSIAVDRKLHVYGTPFWIEAELPLVAPDSKDAFRRLMIAQDTGSAIVGPARADLYFGAGDEAGRVSGRIRNPARFVMLVPRTLEPGLIEKPVPFPPPRPAEEPPS